MILAIDPSGNFNEGKGITGWILMKEDTGKVIKFGAIDASTSICAEEHWHKHVNLLLSLQETYKNITVVCEDYMLYADKAATQINSRMETPKLIGILQYVCYMNHMPLHLQTAVSVKRRWKNFLLEKKGFIILKTYTKVVRGVSQEYELTYIGEYKVNDHVIDALRHAVHYYTFQCKDKEGLPNDTDTPEDLQS